MTRIVIFLIISLASISIAIAQVNVDYYIVTGKQKILDNDNHSAIEYFSALIRFKPKIADAYYFRAIAKSNLGDYRGAITDFGEAIDLNPFFPFYYIYRGIAKERLYDYLGSNEDYTKAIDIEASNPSYYLYRGVSFIQLKRYDEAIEDFRTCLRIDKNNANAFLFRAIAKQGKALYDDAMLDFNKAIRLNQFNPDAYIRRGRNLAEMKDYKAAIQDFDRAIRLDSVSTFALYNRAIAKYELNDSVGTMNDYNRIIELDRENALTYYNRAALKVRFGELKSAIEDYDKVIKLNPVNVFTYFNRALIWHQLNQFQKAIDDYSTAINLSPEFSTAYYNRSLARKSIKDYFGAEQDYNIALKINANLRKKGQSGNTDSTNLAKITEFKADFEEGNRQGLRNSRFEYISFPNFKVNYIVSDSVAGFQTSLSEKMLDFNKEFQSPDKFVLTYRQNNIPQNKAQQLISTVNDTTAIADKLNLLAGAIAKSGNQNFNGAIACYNLMIKHDPQFNLAYFNRANTRYEMIKYITSFADDNNMISIDNQNNQQNNRQVSIQYFDEVIADYNQCIILEPMFYYAYFNIANIKAETKDYLGAIYNYTNALNIEPNFAEAYYNRGLTYIYLQKQDKGCVDLSKAGELGVQRAYSAIKKYCK